MATLSGLALLISGLCGATVIDVQHQAGASPDLLNVGCRQPMALSRSAMARVILADPLRCFHDKAPRTGSIPEPAGDSVKRTALTLFLVHPCRRRAVLVQRASAADLG